MFYSLMSWLDLSVVSTFGNGSIIAYTEGNILRQVFYRT
jgi:hypothetical protein